MGYLKDREHLENILSVASYGSSWFSYGTPNKFTEMKQYQSGKFEYREQRWAQILLDGGYIIVCDDEEEKEYELTLKKLEKAWQNEDPQVVRAKANIINGDDDFYDADAIIQCAIFGEVVYG